MVDVFVASVPSLPFKPTIHVNYQEAVFSMKDGLPKLRDLPKELAARGATSLRKGNRGKSISRTSRSIDFVLVCDVPSVPGKEAS